MQDKELDRLLKNSLTQTEEAAPPELDALLKAKLYQREAVPGTPRRVRLWWLPMVANLLVCGVPAIIFALPIMPFAAHLAAFALAWLAVGGVVLTLVGLKFSNLKEQLVVYLPTRAGKEVIE